MNYSTEKINDENFDNCCMLTKKITIVHLASAQKNSITNQLFSFSVSSGVCGYQYEVHLSFLSNIS